jgi:hypothetical protein
MAGSEGIYGADAAAVALALEGAVAKVSTEQRRGTRFGGRGSNRIYGLVDTLATGHYKASHTTTR